MMNLLDKVPEMQGYTTLFSKTADGKVTNCFYERNQIMDDSAEVLANLLINNPEYALAYIYFEFQNLASPGDAPTVPSFTKADSVEYYTGLEFSADADFLRIPVIAKSDITRLGSGGGSLISLLAAESGQSTGFWGKPFSSGSNSAIYGAALVSAPKPSSQANDLIFARNYPSGAKILKSAGEQVSIIWNVELALPS